MDVTPMLRRPGVPRADWTPPASDPELVARIRSEIDAAGPMTFARFMELALYDPAHGYYRLVAPGPGRDGDFLTAPEVHPLFGATLALAVVEVWRAAGSPRRFAIVEYGAGRGALAMPLLGALAEEHPELVEAVDYVPIELNEHRVAELRARLASAGLTGVLRAHSRPTVGIAIANEYLDALPVHVVEPRDGRLAELFVVATADGALSATLGPPSTPALEARLLDEDVRLAEGQRAEICLDLEDWVADVSRRIGRGVLLVIDYGAPAAELYGPSRMGGTLMAYAGHRAHDDPFAGIGRQDLTAHVDLTAVQRALVAQRWRPLGHTSQAAFLAGSGMEGVLARMRARATDLESQLALRAATGRLLDPRSTGGFHVLAASRGLPRPFSPAGFAYRIPGGRSSP